MAQAFTAPAAIIKVNGEPVGKVQNMQVRETYQRERVEALGQLYADEAPIVGFQGTLSFQLKSVAFKTEQIPGIINRSVQTVEEWASWLILQEEGVSVDVMRRVKTGTKSNGAPETALEIYSTIEECFVDEESFSVALRQVATRSVNLQYLTPIVYPT